MRIWEVAAHLEHSGPSGKMDRYKVLDLIGEGSFGRVFRGVQRDTGANVALKLIPKVNQRGYLTSISLLHLAGGSQRTGAAVAEVGM